MRRNIRKWAMRLTATITFITALLLLIILQPGISYAHKTTFSRLTIYHSQKLHQAWPQRLEAATQLASTSEYYDPQLPLDICLNDGSYYPALIEKLGGHAFARGFYNKLVLFGIAHADSNFIMLNGYTWDLEQLLAHEMIHCFQFHQKGLLHANPIAGIPTWKWEGYPEYISRRNADQTNLAANIKHLQDVQKQHNNGWIYFADSTGTVIDYYKARLLVQYCLEIKKLSYDQLLQKDMQEENVYQEMIQWYLQQSVQP